MLPAARYGLNCVKASKDVSSDAIAQLVTSKVSGAQMRTDIGTEITFSLPIDQTDSFPELFRSMDSQKSSLGLATFGLTQTSLEEVFLNLASTGEHAEETTGTATTVGRVDNPVADEPLHDSMRCMRLSMPTQYASGALAVCTNDVYMSTT